MTVVIDASALIAVLLDEPGAEWVIPELRGSVMSSVNYGETVSRIAGHDKPTAIIDELIEQFEIAIHPFDRAQARRSGELRPATKYLGLSLGDRACLAMAELLGLTIITGDRRLAAFDMGIGIRLIR